MSGTAPYVGQPRSPNGASPGVIASAPWAWRDPTTHPPRPWLLGTVLMRGYTTLLGSPGGVGKTTWAVAAALAVITGRRDLLGYHSWLTGNVWFVTLEDDRVELDRRIAAAMLEHQIAAADVQGKLTVTEGPLKLVDYGTARHPVAQRTGEADDVEKFISDNNIVLTVIDPLVKAHSVNGSLPEDMDALITVCNEIARATSSALLLPCHFRKGGRLDSDGQDAFRGASSLVDGARIALGVQGMTEREADEFGVDKDERGSFVRMVNAKANMTAKADATDWFEITGRMLGNTHNPTYPAGDSVQAIRQWQAPKLFDGMDLPVMQAIFGRLGDPSQIFHATPGGGKNWAGTVVMAVTGKTKDQATRILRLWINSGTLVETTYQNTQRNTRSKLVPDPAKVAAILASCTAAHSGP